MFKIAKNIGLVLLLLLIVFCSREKPERIIDKTFSSKNEAKKKDNVVILVSLCVNIVEP